MYEKLRLLICALAFTAIVDSAPRPQFANVQFQFEPLDIENPQGEQQALDAELQHPKIILFKAGHGVEPNEFKVLDLTTQLKEIEKALHKPVVKKDLQDPEVQTPNEDVNKGVQEEELLEVPILKEGMQLSLKDLVKTLSAQNPTEGVNEEQQESVDISNEGVKTDLQEAGVQNPVECELKDVHGADVGTSGLKGILRRCPCAKKKVKFDDSNASAEWGNMLGEFKKQTDQQFEIFKTFIKSTAGLTNMDDAAVSHLEPDVHNKSTVQTESSDGERITMKENSKIFYNENGDQIGLHRVTVDREQMPKSEPQSVEKGEAPSFELLSVI